MVIDQGRATAGKSGDSRSATAERGLSAGTIVAIFALLAVGYGLTILVFQPGYVTIDATYVYADSQDWQFGDWQSPAMAILWWLVDPIAPGGLSMFLLIATLYWLGFGLVAFTVARRSTWLGLLTLFVALTPPAFVFIGMIWRDVLFGVVWLVAGAVVFAAADRTKPIRIPAQAVALGLVALGVLLRPNAIFAAALLAAYAVWPSRFDWKRTAIMFVPAAAVFYALVPLTYYGLLDSERQNPLHSLMVFDLGGITHFSRENQFPVSWTAEETAQLLDRCYDPVRWDTYWHMTPCPFVMDRLERKDDPFFGTPRLVEAWWRAITSHPLAYLRHRATFMWTFLAKPNLVLPYYDWLKPTPVYGENPYFKPLLALHHILAPTILFRTGLWLVLAISVGALAWPARAMPAGAFALAMSTSAAAYLMTFLAVGVAADFRYGYWGVLATLVGGVAVLQAFFDYRRE